jgi:hypothetical protein
VAEDLYRVELTASFLERLDAIEAFLTEADAAFAFDDLLAEPLQPRRHPGRGLPGALARGTQFRRWATERLREYLVKGFTLDDERLKNPPVGGSAVPDRFDELLERIRDIRASERRMYLRVREIFAMAADYAPTLPETTQFFRVIQNKLHFAVTGKTAAELIAERADSSLPEHGSDHLEIGQRAEGRRDRGQELSARTRNRRAQPHRDDVAGLRGRPGTPPQRGLPERLGREAGCFPEVQRARCVGRRRQGFQEAGRCPRGSQYEAVRRPARALLEAEGEAFNMRALEDAAKALPKSKGK